MFVLRASLLVIGMLVFGAVSSLAVSSLAAIDRELSVLCLRLPGANDTTASAIRLRLATLWRAREAFIARLPARQRAAAVHSELVSVQCLALAKATAEPPRRPSPGGGRRGYKYSAPRPSVAPPAARPSPPSVVLQAPSGQDRSASVDTPKAVPPPPPDRPAPAPVPAPNGGARPTAPVDSSTQLPDFFPWPPPAPSDRRLLQLSQLGSGTPPDTWGALADRILALVRKARYRSWGFYAAPGGFAVVTRIEQLDQENGVALAGDQRWASEVKVAGTSILDGIFTVRRPRGVYRVIAFVLTTDPRSGGPVTDPAVMLQLARRWGISGALDLPEVLRSNPITRVQRLFALVYEFESAVGGETRVHSPGLWTLDHHFEDAGIVIIP